MPPTQSIGIRGLIALRLVVTVLTSRIRLSIGTDPICVLLEFHIRSGQIHGSNADSVRTPLA